MYARKDGKVTSTVLDRREQLRVKLKSLAEEARIIRKEERRIFGQLREELYRHRIGIVRFEARCSHLAYGFIRGLTLEQMEPRRNVDIPEYVAEAIDKALFKRVQELIKKYGPKDSLAPEVLKKAA